MAILTKRGMDKILRRIMETGGLTEDMEKDIDRLRSDFDEREECFAGTEKLTTEKIGTNTNGEVEMKSAGRTVTGTTEKSILHVKRQKTMRIGVDVTKRCVSVTWTDSLVEEMKEKSTGKS